MTVLPANVPGRIVPTSRPPAENVAGFATGSAPTQTAPLDKSRLLREGAMLVSAVAGTVKLDAPAGATHANTAEALDGVSTPPPKMSTDCPAGAPVQLTEKPAVRVMVVVWSRLVHESG